MSAAGLPAAAARLSPRLDGRFAAPGSVVLAAVLAIKLPAVYAAAPYLAVVEALLLLAAAAISVRLWCVDRAVCRLAAVTICGAVAVGQVLHGLVGMPGAPSLGRGIGGWGLVAIGAEVFVTVVLVAARIHPKPVGSPYARSHGEFGARGRG